jgi:hypothetical protein
MPYKAKDELIPILLPNDRGIVPVDVIKKILEADGGPKPYSVITLDGHEHPIAIVCHQMTDNVLMSIYAMSGMVDVCRDDGTYEKTIPVRFLAEYFFHITKEAS